MQLFNQISFIIEWITKTVRIASNLFGKGIYGMIWWYQALVIHEIVIQAEIEILELHCLISTANELFFHGSLLFFIFGNHIGKIITLFYTTILVKIFFYKSWDFKNYTYQLYRQLTVPEILSLFLSVNIQGFLALFLALRGIIACLKSN